MERLYSIGDLMERYQKSEATIRRYLKQIRHQKKPTLVPESALKEWEDSRTVNPPELIRAEMRRQKLLRRMA